MEERNKTGTKIKELGFWKWAIASVLFRLIFSYFSKNLNLSSRPEVSTPLTSLRRLSEGYWLKQLSMSPYSGSMYHGSPLLLSILGPLTVKKIGGHSSDILCSLFSLVADFISAILIRAIGQSLVRAHLCSWKALGLDKLFKGNDVVPCGDVAALVYLWNPFTIVSCIGFNTSPIENMFVIMSLYGASGGLVPLAAFGWVIASHLSLYPIVLVIPVIFLLGYGLDAPPSKLFVQSNFQVGEQGSVDHVEFKSLSDKFSKTKFSWRRVIVFFLWASLWASYVLTMCAISMKDYGGLAAMFKRTYGFILGIEDLSPNIGVLWYFIGVKCYGSYLLQ